MKNLRSKRLLMRQWYLSDADDLFEYAQNPLVGPPAGWSPHVKRADSERLIKELFQVQYFHWAIVLPERMKVIGGINLTQDPRRNYPQSRCLGYSMNPDFWGYGFMTEAAKGVLKYAFEYLKLAIVSVYHYPDNIRSRRVIEKCGFTYEGRLRQSSFLFNSKVLDNCCYSMTADEYKQLYMTE